jgi:hypothetical protein
MTTNPPNEDHFRYDVMVQEALIGVVRKVLIEAARSGLPGDHHFYVTFRSQGPGVKLSARLREKYPEEMTIVLQHQFWDLTVSEQGFEVGLSFGGVAERLVVPFDALTGFYDPSVQFGLKFTPDEATADNDSGEEPEPASVKEQLDAIVDHEKGAKGKSGGKGRSKDRAEDAPARKGRGKAQAPAGPAEPADAVPEDLASEKPNAGAEVVSLDAFRKKK